MLNHSECLVDVYITTYNRAQYLKESIQSVLNQTYRNFELTILDNCSSDETEEIVKSFQDERIHYIRHEKNIGGLGNISYAFSASQKKYFIVFHDDDIMAPDLLEKEVSLLEKELEVVAVSCKSDSFAAMKSAGVSYECMDTIRYGNGTFFEAYVNRREFIPFPPTMYRTAFMRKYDINLIKQAGPSADALLFMDIERCGGKIAVINTPMFFYRFHDGQDSQNSRVEMVCKLFAYLNTDEYYRKRLRDNSSGINWYYKRIMFNEICLFASNRIQYEELKADNMCYLEVLKVSFITKQIVNVEIMMCKKIPKVIRAIYGKIRRRRDEE